MGLTHDFIGFPPIRVNENNNTINWWPHSCTLASIKGLLQERANSKHITKTEIKSIMKEDASIAFEICLTIHNRIMSRLDNIAMVLIILICFIAEKNPFLGLVLVVLSAVLIILAIIVYCIIQQIYNNYDMNFSSELYDELMLKNK